MTGVAHRILLEGGEDEARPLLGNHRERCRLCCNKACWNNYSKWWRNRIRPLRRLSPVVMHFVYPLPGRSRALPNLLIHGNAQLPQLDFGRLDLPHQLLVRLGNVVESQDAPAEAEEEVCAQANDRP